MRQRIVTLITHLVNDLTLLRPANSCETTTPVSRALRILLRGHILLLLSVLLLLAGFDDVAHVLAVQAEPLFVLGNDIHLETLEMESHMGLVADEDAVWVILPTALMTAAFLAFLLLIVHAGLTFRWMFSVHWSVHLVLELLVPLCHLDGLLQPEHLIREEHLAALHGVSSTPTKMLHTRCGLTFFTFPRNQKPLFFGSLRLKLTRTSIFGFRPLGLIRLLAQGLS